MPCGESKIFPASFVINYITTLGIAIDMSIGKQGHT